MTYWEKTVEYAFLALAIKEERVDFAAPLSGMLERGSGDAMFAENASYILVEFKASESGMADEKRKFRDYDGAKEALVAEDGHHFFVYGKLHSKRLTLVSQTYFSGKPPKSDDSSALGCFACGVNKAVFDVYLHKLLSYRKPDERGDGGAEVSDYATVIGIAPDGKSAIACTLRDYASKIAPESVPAAESKTASTRPRRNTL